jgi:predicted RNA-binding protein YlqC (UPF0109 family)
MTEYANTPKSPAFEGPSFEEPQDDDDLDIEDEDVDLQDLDIEAPDVDDDAGNRVTGGTARSVLEYVARSIVDDPDAVIVDVSEARSGLKLSLHVAPGDMGRIIGKRGRVAQAIRALVRAAAARDGTDATVDIVD